MIGKHWLRADVRSIIETIPIYTYNGGIKVFLYSTDAHTSE